MDHSLCQLHQVPNLSQWDSGRLSVSQRAENSRLTIPLSHCIGNRVPLKKVRRSIKNHGSKFHIQDTIKTRVGPLKIWVKLDPFWYMRASFSRILKNILIILCVNLACMQSYPRVISQLLWYEHGTLPV